MNIFEQAFKLFLNGGPIIMGLILLCSFVATFIIAERILYYKKIKDSDNKIIEKLSNAINKGRYDEALAICDTSPTPVTALMKAGIKHREYNENQIQESIKNAANIEIPKLEKYLTTLGTIANVSTLLGLLGTVLGNMEALGVIGSQSLIGKTELLANGISQALLTTAFGLIVAIPTTIFYNYLTNKVNNMILSVETEVNELVLLLIKGKNKVKEEKDGSN